MMHVLIVDDHAGMRSLLRELIEQLVRSFGSGVAPEVRECASGEAALEGEPPAPALATVDVQMSGMGGIECVRRLHARWPACRVVVVTQFDVDRIRPAALAAGAERVVSKDDLTALESAVSKQLEELGRDR